MKRYNTFKIDKDGNRVGVKEASITPAEAAKRKAEKKTTKPKKVNKDASI